MRLAIVVSGGLGASGYGTRISSMVRSYADAGHRVDMYHVHLAGGGGASEQVRNTVENYFEAQVPRSSWISRLNVVPPFAWLAKRAAGRWEAIQEAPHYDAVQAENSSVWPVALRLETKARILVLHDDDARRLHLAAASFREPLHRLARESDALKHWAFQRRAMRAADECWFVSPIEMERFSELRGRPNFEHVPNGAADEMFEIEATPDLAHPTVLFVGPPGYEANRFGIRWFLKRVWPEVVGTIPSARLKLVGRRWSEAIPASGSNVDFEPFVEDLAAELGRTAVVIAPLFLGGGTKLKVIEAMAAARPVVTTPVGIEGIPMSSGVVVSEDPVTFSTAIKQFLTDSNLAQKAGAANRQAVKDMRWSKIWDGALMRLEVTTGL